MKNVYKRMLSLILAIVMIVGQLPTAGYADFVSDIGNIMSALLGYNTQNTNESDDEDDEIVSQPAKLTNVSPREAEQAEDISQYYTASFAGGNATKHYVKIRVVFPLGTVKEGTTISGKKGLTISEKANDKYYIKEVQVGNETLTPNNGSLTISANK